MGISSEERGKRIHELDMSRQTGLHQSDLIHRDEESRRLKLQLLLSRDESTTLAKQLGESARRHRLLATQYEQTRARLDSAQKMRRSQEAKLKKQATDLVNLKAEVKSLQSSMQDSGKALRERDEHGISRELDKLRSEVDHLRSQLANYQAVIAEKHSLQRQLDTLEVELENERRSKHRMQDKENKSAMDEIRSRAEDAEKRLAAEVRERERMAKQHEKVLSEASDKNERLEERTLSMKDKVKGLQTELKAAMLQLERRHDDTNRPEVTAPTTKKTALPAQNEPKKRRADEVSFEEITIMTPGNESQTERRQAKKRGGAHAPLGEKSNFSITPFLNRSRSMAESGDSPEIPPSVTTNPIGPASEIEEEEKKGKDGAPAPTEPAAEFGPDSNFSPMHTTNPKQPTTKKPRGRPKAKPLGETSPERKNSTNQAGPGPKRRRGKTTGVEPDAAGQENAVSPSKAPELKNEPTPQPDVGNESQTAPPPAIKELDVKKKRRKLLGAANSTLFDEDDGEAMPEHLNAPIGPAGKRKRAPLGGPMNAFAGATFSPLKRDRRGAGASFLG